MAQTAATFRQPVTLEAGDTPRLTGRAVPYGVVSAPAMDGRNYRFSGPPSNELVGAVAVREHDDATPIGTVSAAESSDDGIDVTIDLLDTSAGRDARAEAAAGVRNGLSVAFEAAASTEGDDGVIDVETWELLHVGHVRHPAYGEHTQAVAASTPTEGATMPEPTTPEAPTTAPSIAPALTVSRPARLPSLAQYGFALANRDESRLARYVEAINLAAGETLVANIPGVIPTQIVGPVIDGRPYDRPIFSALGPSSGPSAGASWKHPVVTDPLADAAYYAEKTSANDTLGIDDVDVSWTAIKRSTNVSREAEVFSDPAVMGIIGEQLARAYARGSEVVATAAIVAAAAGGNAPISLALGGAGAVGAIVGGSVIHYGQVGAPADLLLMNPADYGTISGWTATDGRQLFPSSGQIVNGGGETSGAGTFGGNIAGIPVVVSWALAAGQNYLVSSDYVKTYEGNRATISVQEAVFGTTVGIFGTVAAAVLLAKAITPVTLAIVTGTSAKK